MLNWRRDHLFPPEPCPPLPGISCLPNDVRDPLGRPILVIEVASLKYELEIKQVLIQAMESLRFHLKTMNLAADRAVPTLQYVVLLDLKDITMPTIVCEI